MKNEKRYDPFLGLIMFGISKEEMQTRFISRMFVQSYKNEHVAGLVAEWFKLPCVV